MKEVEERTSELGIWVNVRRSRMNGNEGQRHVFGRECVLNVSCPSGLKPQLALAERITHEHELERT